MSVSWTWDLEAEISGVWTSIAEDLLWHKTPIIASRGIAGRDIADRVAQPGSLTATLDNGESNSAGLLGYYSPDHANMRANFGRNTNVRLKITYNGSTRYLWKGYITDLGPTPGRYRERESYLSATDFIQRMAEHKLKLIPVQENQRSDQLLQTVLNNMSVTPATTAIETDKFILPIALYSEQDERTTALSVAQKICQTTLGYLFPRGNATNGETLVFQREETRCMQSSVATLDNTMSSLKISRSVDDMKNRVDGTIHPVKVDTEATTLLYDLDNELPLDGGDTRVVSLKFRDPYNLAVRISGKDVVVPLVASTHYRMSKNPGTFGEDMNASLTVTTTVGGNAVEATLENTAGRRGYINLLRVYGKGIYYYNPIELYVESGDGDKSVSYDFPYLSDPYRAKGFLTALHYRTSTEITLVDTVSFLADENSTLMGYAMSVDIGDRITITEAATGISDAYTINKVTYTIETNGTLRVEWSDLEPADARSYFILDSSELDGADVLSPY